MREAGALNPNGGAMEESVIEIYLWADGKNFDVDRFQGTLPARIRGTSELRKGVKRGVVKYWKSEVRKVISGNPEPALHNLLFKYKFGLLRARENGATRVFAEIVVNWRSLDELCGFYFSNKTVRLLSEIGASIDIDIYERFSKDAKFTLDYNVGDSVKLIKKPGWVESLSLESQKNFDARMNHAYQVIGITLDGLLVLDARKHAAKAGGEKFMELRVDPRCVHPSKT